MKSELDVKLSVGFGIFIFIAVAIYKGPNFTAEIFDAAAKAITATVLARTLFIRWIWKWMPFLERFHGVPNVAGKWTGSFDSTYAPAPGAATAKGAVEATITQPDIFRVKITQKTGESISHSYGEVFETLEDGSLFLNFSYQNVPNATVRGRSQISFGSARYLLERGAGSTLNGNYWTDRKSTGQIRLIKK